MKKAPHQGFEVVSGNRYAGQDLRFVLTQQFTLNVAIKGEVGGDSG